MFTFKLAALATVWFSGVVAAAELIGEAGGFAVLGSGIVGHIAYASRAFGRVEAGLEALRERILRVEKKIDRLV